MSLCPDMSDRDVLEAVMQVEDIERTEGSRGVDNLHKLAKMLGYDTPFRDAFEEFLSDNSGCIEAIHQWIADNMCPEWRDNLETYVPEDDDSEEMTDEEHELRVAQEYDEMFDEDDGGQSHDRCVSCFGQMKSYMVPSANPQDKSLFEVYGCPHCDGTN